jgi:transaldolase/glucose-6-phosphate isomerase
VRVDEELGPLGDATDEVAASLVGLHVVERMLERDHTLWQDDPTEVADRLGWLDCPTSMRMHLDELRAFAGGCVADGIERVLVAGMGGSSLFPEVLASSFPGRPGGLGVDVLDTTDPAAVARATAAAVATPTLVLAASKSGTTIETRSHLEHLWATIGDPSRFAATTDPGSQLGRLAAERGFRAIFENPADIGGRYSALSLFGLVPAALAGIDPGLLLDGGAEALDDLLPALRLGAAMAAGARTGRDKLTFAIEPGIASFGLWVEQLIAESTGKSGTGVLPVVGEALGPPEAYDTDRLFVAVGTLDPAAERALAALGAAGHPVLRVSFDGDRIVALGAQVMLWEGATALCGSALRINPFDQPDVAAAKAATQAVLDAGAVPRVDPTPAVVALAAVRPGDYIAIHAYVDPASPVVATLEAARLAIRDRLAAATTIGLGPRFLHSTGQFHKGGPPSGVFLQVVGDDPEDVPIPGAPYGFATLKQAQAAGDLATLHERGLRAARIDVDDLVGWTEGSTA